MKTNLFLTFSVLLLSLTGCKKDDVSCSCQDPAPCDQMAVVDDDLFANGPDDEFFPQEVRIEGDCLYLRFQYSGGCEEVDYQLLSGTTVAYSLPPQRTIRFSLDDDDPCEALPVVEATFNLRPFRVAGQETVVLNFEGWGESLTYIY